ncbi:MAG: hypothetical protein ABTR07_14260 [Candidatus Competibacter denitrificans]
MADDTAALTNIRTIGSHGLPVPTGGTLMMRRIFLKRRQGKPHRLQTAFQTAIGEHS